MRKIVFCPVQREKRLKKSKPKLELDDKDAAGLIPNQ
jgi:hypothetical protein